jgi:hypothetical protein
MGTHLQKNGVTSNHLDDSLACLCLRKRRPQCGNSRIMFDLHFCNGRLKARDFLALRNNDLRFDRFVRLSLRRHGILLAPWTGKVSVKQT